MNQILCLNAGCTVRMAQNALSALFAAAPVEPVRQTPRLDADLLLCHVLETDRTHLLINFDRVLTEPEISALKELAEKRITGLPVAYLVGHKEFFGFDFIVTPDVLIPKPDTELLVEHALDFLQPRIRSSEFSSGNPLFFADICTGSGCIAISVLKSLNLDPAKNINCFATDISEAALTIARKNAESLAAGGIIFLHGDLAAPLLPRYKGKLQAVLSNPPYVPRAVAESLLLDGRSEPMLALNGDDGTSTDGLALIRRLVPQAEELLAPGGIFLLETGEYNAADAAILLEAAGFDHVEIAQDLAGMPRLVKGIKP